MHTRRIAAFLLGAWLGGSVLMLLLSAANANFTDWLLSSPSDQATAFMKKAGRPQDLAFILKYQAAEQNRRYSHTWQEAQIALGLALALCLFLGTQKRPLPLVFCGMMVLLVGFELVVSPELIYRGRLADFPPGNEAFETVRRIYALGQIVGWIEAAKLILGGVLVGYLFIFRPRRGRRSSNNLLEGARTSPVES